MNICYLEKRTFTAKDQSDFALFSGDSNPMHMDALSARRTQAGRPVVHGIHAFLWSLEVLCKNGSDLSRITSAKVSFNKFAYVDREITLCVQHESSKRIKLEVLDNDLPLISIKLDLHDTRNRLNYSLAVSEATEHVSQPLELDLGDIAEHLSTLDVNESEVDSAVLFPRLQSCLGQDTIASIAKMSTVVGMHCPGLHSIFSGFRIQFGSFEKSVAGLRYKVINVDPRFRMVNLEVEGFDFCGIIESFVRHKPVQISSFNAVDCELPENCFANINALVIGGSRGLGEAIARLIVAGGGKVTITYKHGESDARTIASELNAKSSTGDCQILEYDALIGPERQLGSLKAAPSDVFYFATTQIFRQKNVDFSSALFSEFCSIYVDGFARLLTHLASLPFEAERMEVFYPSSTALDERPKGMTEYTMAKAAGEILCADLNEQIKDMNIFATRLPRVRTDQTATVTPVESADATTLMLQIIKQMHPELFISSERHAA